MKLFVNGRYVKMIPKMFEKIPNVEEFIQDLEHKRLTDSERESLERELLRLYLQDFVNQTKGNHKLRPYVNGSDPSAVLRIRTMKKNYCAVRFTNGFEIRCSKELFMNAPIRKEVTRLY